MPDSDSQPDNQPDIEIRAFQSAFGRLCDLAAQALRAGVDTEAVRRAFLGLGEEPELADLRAHRTHVNHRVELVKHFAGRFGVSEADMTRAVIRAARAAREAAEGEWMVEIPVARPQP